MNNDKEINQNDLVVDKIGSTIKKVDQKSEKRSIPRYENSRLLSSAKSNKWCNITNTKDEYRSIEKNMTDLFYNKSNNNNSIKGIQQRSSKLLN